MSKSFKALGLAVGALALTHLPASAQTKVTNEGISANEIEQGHIIVSYGLKNGAPYLSVTDNGIGLPQENRHRLAEPYMTTREKGTGLGLAIVKRIMEEHGGTLSLSDSPAGQGACVTLNFPSIDVLQHTPVEDALS